MIVQVIVWQDKIFAFTAAGTVYTFDPIRLKWNLVLEGPFMSPGD